MEGFRKKKKYGQNFLTSPAIPKKIVEQSGIDSSFGILEIGAGQGILTEELAHKASKVVAVEIDTELIGYLEDKFASYDNVIILNADIMETDLSAIVNSYFAGLTPAVCANLPYYITTPIIMKLLESGLFTQITVMVQKEVASRLVAAKGSPDYGAITAVCSYYSVVKKLFNVPPGAFSPPPSVDSSVILFAVRTSPPVFPKDKNLMFSLIKAAFSQRRKIFSNSIYSCLNNLFTKQQICDMLTEAGFGQYVRGEELDIYDFARISDLITSKIIT